ncbi:hypothetical protein ALMP_67760 [Streptomyces sp. A012304]|nr:hypothetical protein ALMP_67760 [Streptomyces sp. A012304]
MGIGVAAWFRADGPHSAEQIAYTYAAEAAVLVTRRARRYGHADPALPLRALARAPAVATSPPASSTTAPCCSPTASRCRWPRTTTRAP